MKCFALGRSTAAAFHFIRCLEGALEAFSKWLSVAPSTKPAQRNWGNKLAEISDQAKVKWPNAADRISGNGKFYEEIYAVFSSMRNPYRNGTMHLEKKYLPEEAYELMILIKGVLNRISSKMDQDGLPFA